MSTKFLACIEYIKMSMLREFHYLSSLHSCYISNFLYWLQTTPIFIQLHRHAHRIFWIKHVIKNILVQKYKIVLNLQWVHVTQVQPQHNFLSNVLHHIRDILKFKNAFNLNFIYESIKTTFQHFRGKNHCYTYSQVRPYSSHQLPELPFMILSSKITLHFAESCF